MRAITWSLLLPVIFFLYSLPLFLRVFSTTEQVIDEEFHLPQGVYFCKKNFRVWNPKITTFPGLYLAAYIFLQPFGWCTILGLRCISFGAAVVNVLLFYKIRRRLLGCGKSTLVALEALTIAALPPLYFFSHLYYTDALSLTAVLLFYYNWLKQKQLQAAVFGAASVLMRQTNIVWICMCCGISALDILSKNYAYSKRLNINEVQLLRFQTWFSLLKPDRLLFKSVFEILQKCVFYIFIILPFIGFIILNGSIVVGDKTAHEAQLHLPQLFYFSIFTMFFYLTNIYRNGRNALALLLHNKLKTFALLSICILIVHFNTEVHPYLLADNRHYVFYIWNRLYGRYFWFKYLITPLYVFALTLCVCGLQHIRDSFKLMFWLSVLLVLCFQRLLELRYFLVPFVIFRLNALPVGRKIWIQWFEVSYYLIINALTFHIFFTKEIKWENYKEPQRIIW